MQLSYFISKFPAKQRDFRVFACILAAEGYANAAYELRSTRNTSVPNKGILDWKSSFIGIYIPYFCFRVAYTFPAARPPRKCELRAVRRYPRGSELSPIELGVFALRSTLTTKIGNDIVLYIGVFPSEYSRVPLFSEYRFHPSMRQRILDGRDKRNRVASARVFTADPPKESERIPWT